MVSVAAPRGEAMNATQKVKLLLLGQSELCTQVQGTGCHNAKVIELQS